MKYKGKYMFTVSKEHLGQNAIFKDKIDHCDDCGRGEEEKKYHISSLLGFPLNSQDIGKQVWLQNNLFYIENDEQYLARIKEERSHKV